MKRRLGIVASTVLLTSGIAAVAVIVAGIVAYPLVRSAAETQARAELSTLTDLTAGGLSRGPEIGREFPRNLLRALEERGISGYLVPPGAPAPADIPGDVVAQALAGESVSAERDGPDGTFLIEARPLADGSALVLQQPYTVVGGVAEGAGQRVLVALLLGLLIAVPIGWWAARWVTRPLRAARDAAHRMTEGGREVTLTPDGPAEVADIGTALNQLNSALVVSEGRQREFLLSVSHELRTPLTAVKGYAEALADGVIPEEDVSRTGATVAAEAARLDRLVSDLLDLARLGAVDFAVQPLDVDLVEVAEDAGQVWRDRAAREGVQVVVDVPQEPLMVRTDPIRLRQVIDNLAENALRVSPPDSVIVLAVRPEDATGVVEVRDSGPGLTDEDIAVAFDPGVLHDRYRGVRPVGTGLGLALVGRLASGLGGSAEAGRAAEGGARFTVRLPRA